MNLEEVVIQLGGEDFWVRVKRSASELIASDGGTEELNN